MSVASEGLNLSKEVTAGTVGTLSDPVRAGLALGPGANLGERFCYFCFSINNATIIFQRVGKVGRLSEFLNTSEAESLGAGAAQTGIAALRSPGPETESKSYKW